MSKVNSNSEIVTVINTLKELDTQKKKMCSLELIWEFTKIVREIDKANRKIDRFNKIQEH